MRKPGSLLIAAVAIVAAFAAGRWSTFDTAVKAQSGGTPQIEVRPIGADASLTVFYPNLNKLFVYQNPFVGYPGSNCAYSIQLSSPGGKVDRQPCPNAGLRF
jgi:hypothetical protein